MRLGVVQGHEPLYDVGQLHVPVVGHHPNLGVLLDDVRILSLNGPDEFPLLPREVGLRTVFVQPIKVPIDVLLDLGLNVVLAQKLFVSLIQLGGSRKAAEADLDIIDRIISKGGLLDDVFIFSTVLKVVDLVLCHQLGRLLLLIFLLGLDELLFRRLLT